MLGTFLTAIATALSLLIVDLVVPGVNIANFPAAMIAALVIGLINGSVKPVLSALSLPLNFATLGGFSLIVNGFCFWLAAVLVPGFAVRGLIAFILGPVILSFANTFINNYFAERNPALNSSGDVNPQGELPSR
ncbi:MULTISPECIES: phage holin family protein [unclassified Nodularia (in: cyanobacteria)]|uniref:phage holin family protein n=1 Tax=unclassified Nodularia (in: cyanobacteria) TaxID=2656917 RepID=UPI00188306FF|nr:MULTISPECIES: phage holin family protein [unclassified Nodularia (in: cyanobacteria)]MBE9199727.1 phage holin family protein [Nodularia sp. LEGE 06071]MCC2693371.1 phage holin family protein [Nodularia sp. LEGE 04288]